MIKYGNKKQMLTHEKKCFIEKDDKPLFYIRFYRQ